MFYVWFDAPIGYIAATQEWAGARSGSATGATGGKSDDVRYVQFLGKDNVPFHTVSFPATLHRLRRAVEDRRRHQGLPLAHLRRRQVLHQPPARHLRRRRAGGVARRPLALVADRQRARERRYRLHARPLRRRREQGSRRRVRQLVNRAFRFTERSLRGRMPGRRRTGRARAALAAEIARARGTRCARTTRRWSSAAPPPRPARSGRAPTPICRTPRHGPASRPTPPAPPPRRAPRSISSACRRWSRGASCRTSLAACSRHSASTRQSRDGRRMSRKRFCA